MEPIIYRLLGAPNFWMRLPVFHEFYGMILLLEYELRFGKDWPCFLICIATAMHSRGTHTAEC